MKSYILEGLLKDEPGTDQRVSNNQLVIYARWAMSELAQHTAVATLQTYNCDGVVKAFALPGNMVDSIEKSGLVGYETESRVEYLPVFRRLPEITWPSDVSREIKAYWEWPSGTLTLGFTPENGDKILLNYFRIWNSPVLDADVLEIPQWMELPFAYIVAALAMEPIGAQSANIRQWNRRMDSGQPEHNPAQKQAAWFIQQAYRYLNRVAPQDRETFYRVEPRMTK